MKTHARINAKVETSTHDKKAGNLIHWKSLVICIAIPLAIGLLSGFLTRNGTALFSMLNRPKLSPPAWLFPVVWTILYVLMGVSSYLVVRQGLEKDEVQKALHTYFLQLFFNFVWPILFFNFGLFLVAFIWLVIMWILILRTILQFAKISRTAAVLLIPYLLWTTFAGYLNFGVYLLN